MSEQELRLDAMGLERICRGHSIDAKQQAIFHLRNNKPHVAMHYLKKHIELEDGAEFWALVQTGEAAFDFVEEALLDE